MDTIAILLKYFAAQLGISEEAAAEQLCEKSEDGKSYDRTKLKPDALTVLTAKDKERVDGIRNSVDKNAIFTEAYNKAKKEEAEKVEKKLADKFGIADKKLKLDDLIAEIAGMQVPKEGELTEENVKKHPLYVSLERSKADEIKAITAKAEQDVETFKKEAAKKETFSTVASEVSAYFDELKPVLSSDSKRAANQKKEFLDKFSGYDFEPIAGTKDFLILEGGKRVEDGHGNPITLKGLTKQKAEAIYDFAVQTPKGNAGNGKDGKEGGGGGKVFKAPTNEEEYTTAIFNASTPEERAEIQTAWEASGNAGE